MIEQTVFIIDDDENVRDSIKELVESVGLNSKTFSSGVEFLEQFNEQLAGCIILDVRMAILSGLALQNILNKMNSSLPIIFISGYGDVSTAAQAFKGGAFDFISKPLQDQNLLDTVNSALQSDQSSRIETSEKNKFKRKVESLTAREQEVFSLVVSGLTNKGVAERLDISPRTVEVHRQRALAKIGASSIVEIKNHLLD